MKNQLKLVMMKKVILNYKMKVKYALIHIVIYFLIKIKKFIQLMEKEFGMF